MKKHFLLALIAAMCCVLQAFADYVAPKFPQTSSPENGKTYYLYNVEMKKYFCFAEDKDHPLLELYGTPVKLEGSSNGFALNIEGSYMTGYWTWLDRASQPDENSYWVFEKTEAGYKLRNLKNSDKYLGSRNNHENELGGSSTLHTEWLLIPFNDANTLYQGKVKLYEALTSAKGTEYDLSTFESLYNSSSSTREDLLNAANVLTNGLTTSNNYNNCSWNEYPLLFTNDGAWLDGSEFRNAKSVNLFVKVTEPSFVTYRLSFHSEENPVEIYIDGKLVRTNDGYSPSNDKCYLSERLTQGSHTITWKVINENNNNFYLKDIAVVNMPLISVDLLEPGSLGTEVLYNVDHIKKVKALKIKGSMNDDDWNKISMMPSLTYLDLSETNIQSIPKYQFSDNKFPFLNEVKLPKTLKRIEDDAFGWGSIEYCEIPENLEYLGSYAFLGTLLHHVNIPATIKDFGEGCNFSQCGNLRKVTLPDNLKNIPYQIFYSCTRLTECNIPSEVEEIGQSAFYFCDKLAFSEFPSTLKKIGGGALQHTNSVKLTIPDGVSIGQSAFNDNPSLTEITLPVNYFESSNNILSNCPQLKKVTLRSATVVQKPNNIGIKPENITIVVPDYLVNSYKLDSYWYNAKAIEGFSTEGIQNWQIHKPLVLGARDRFKGTPNMGIYGKGSLKVNGDAAMTFNNFFIETNGDNVDYTAQMWSKCDNVSINGTATVAYYTSENNWYYISLPFNIKVSDIATQNDAQFAIRYYDGAARAENGVGGSWKNYQADDVIAAGTGFIFQTSKRGWNYFKSLDDESKQYIVSNKEFAKKLEANPSEVSANKGWNLVGNPYQSYYNAHKLNFTAPITLWDRNARTYKAYSLIDDDIAIQPSQAFFVQCPDEVESITFPLEGRQLTSVIESQTAAPAVTPEGTQPARRIADIVLSQGELADKTRVVINERASVAYEMNCDASKFMSNDNQVPQLYSLDEEGIAYAINERPLNDDGRITLGFFAANEGVFTLECTRHNFDHLFLTDHVKGITTDIAQQAYKFNSEAGTFNKRFSLSLTSPSNITGIEEIQGSQGISVSGNTVNFTGHGMAEIFTTDGRCIARQNIEGKHTINLQAGVYVIRFNSANTKVTINR